MGKQIFIVDFQFSGGFHQYHPVCIAVLVIDVQKKIVLLSYRILIMTYLRKTVLFSFPADRYLIVLQNLLKLWHGIHQAAVINHKSICGADHDRIVKDAVRTVQQIFQRPLRQCQILHPFIPGIIGIKNTLHRVEQLFRIHSFWKKANALDGMVFRPELHSHHQHQVISVMDKSMFCHITDSRNIYFIFSKIGSTLVKQRTLQIHLI